MSEASVSSPVPPQLDEANASALEAGRPQLADRTVLYGGSFDPPHLGHQMACLYLLEGLGADKIWLLPSDHHPFGKAMTPFAQRRRLCAAMAAALGPRVEICDVESRLGGAGHTYDTLCHLQAAEPQRRFALAIGADIVAELPRWYRWEAICARVPVAIIGRSGYPGPADGVQLPNLASSVLRQRRSAGQSLAGLVPVAVAVEIEAMQLYRPAP